MTQNRLAIRSSFPPFSRRLNGRVPRLLAILGIAIAITLVLSASYGDYPVPPLEVMKATLGLPTSNADYAFIVTTLRLPRAIAAVLVGVALAIAGTITQGILRNPLAAPGIVGINAGAALATVTLIVVLPEVSVSLLPIAAFAGGFAVFVAIYLLAWNGGSSPMRLVLVGIGFAMMAMAVTNILVTFGNINNVSQALVWLAGSVYGCGWEEVWALLPWLSVFVPVAIAAARDLNVLALGDDIARSVGSPLEWRRGLLLVSSVALAGAAVATAGTIAFVGVAAPHMARRLVGPAHERVVPTAALTGGLLVAIADFLGRTLFSPIELPCGLVTAAIGAPYFLYLLARRT